MENPCCSCKLTRARTSVPSSIPTAWKWKRCSTYGRAHGGDCQLWGTEHHPHCRPVGSGSAAPRSTARAPRPSAGSRVPGSETRAERRTPRGRQAPPGSTRAGRASRRSAPGRRTSCGRSVGRVGGKAAGRRLDGSGKVSGNGSGKAVVKRWKGGRKGGGHGARLPSNIGSSRSPTSRSSADSVPGAHTQHRSPEVIRRAGTQSSLDGLEVSRAIVLARSPLNHSPEVIRAVVSVRGPYLVHLGPRCSNSPAGSRWIPSSTASRPVRIATCHPRPSRVGVGVLLLERLRNAVQATRPNKDNKPPDARSAGCRSRWSPRTRPSTAAAAAAATKEMRCGAASDRD